MKRFFGLCTIAVLLALLLSSCGGNAAVTAQTEVPMTESPETADTESGGEGNLETWKKNLAAADLSDASAVAACFARYEALSAEEKAAVGYADFKKLADAEYAAVHAEKLADLDAHRQDVIAAVAKAYYDQSYRSRTDETVPPQFLYDQYNSRYNVHVSPEDATAQNALYIACSAYASSVYHYTFGSGLLADKSISTTNIDAEFASQKADPDSELMFYFSGAALEELKKDAARAAETIAAIKAALQPGDVLNYRKSTGSGHAVLYYGNGKCIHSTGASNAKTSGGDKDPKTSRENGTADENRYGTVFIDDWDIFFTATLTPAAQNDGRTGTTNSYIFADSITSVAIFRPTNEKDGRMKNKPLTEGAVAHYLYPGIDIEKTASVRRGEQTVPMTDGNSCMAGDEITFTVTVRNNSDTAMPSLTATETVPLFMEYVSSCDGAVYFAEEKTVALHVASLGAGQTAEFSYTLRVSADAAGGKTVSDLRTYVNGIRANVLSFSVGAVRPDASALEKAVQDVTGEKFADGIAAAAAVYKKLSASGFSCLTDLKTPKTVIDTLLAGHTLRSGTKYGGAVACTLYGGYKVGSAELSAATGSKNFQSMNTRTRRVMQCALEDGDILVTYSSYLKEYGAVLYCGGRLFGVRGGTFGEIDPATLSSGADGTVQAYLDTLTAYNDFLVLRPALLG